MMRDATELSAALQRALDERMLNYPAEVFSVLDSTNSYAKEKALLGADRALIVALEQTAGRGRMERSFYSPAETGVYFSILHAIESPLANAVSVTSAAAVAVRRAILRVCGIATEIKWVNDLYLNGKKVCGILTEAVRDPNVPTQYGVIVGIGINLRSAELPRDLKSVAGTLGDDRADVCDLIVAVAEELAPFLEDPADREWLADYRRYSAVLGREITWRRGDAVGRGIALDVDENGALLVQSEAGERLILNSGEISVRLG